jgi:hypothetical protein
MSSFELCLIEGEGIARRLFYTITDALRAGIRAQFPGWTYGLSKRGSGKASWRFRLGLLSDQYDGGGSNNGKDGDLSVFQSV